VTGKWGNKLQDSKGKALKDIGKVEGGQAFKADRQKKKCCLASNIPLYFFFFSCQKFTFHKSEGEHGHVPPFYLLPRPLA
jgi:hypothetical protein